MTETMCLSSGVLIKAGANANSTITADPVAMTAFINQAESTINAMTRINYTDTYAGLNADVQKILEQVCSDLAAMYVINYDMSGFTSRSEAQTMLDVLRDNVTRGISLLRDKKTTTFINAA